MTTLIDENALVEIVIPVYNEEEQLEQSVLTLHNYLEKNFPYCWRITVADNASTDHTWKIAQYLEDTFPEVRALHLDQKGRGRALRYAWSNSEADVVAYMDVDLSTGLEALVPLVTPLVTGHSDVAIGSRLARGAKVKRQVKREIISRCYNFLIKLSFFNRFSDAQCGFKAIRKEVANRLLPLIENNEWFFDTEMLLLAEHNALPIHEVPVRWIDDPDSRVNIGKTIKEDLRGLWRMRKLFWNQGGYIQPEVITPAAKVAEPELATSGAGRAA